MLIYIMDAENQKVIVEFTDEELLVDKFHQTTNGILNKYNGELKGNEMILTPKKAQKKDNIGILIDDIREDLVCDVLPEESPKKDKNKSMTLSFTPHQTQQPEEPEEPLIEDKLKDFIKKMKQ